MTNQKQKRELDRQTKNLREAYRKNNRAKLKKAIRLYLRSEAAKRSALDIAFSELKNKGTGRRKPAYESEAKDLNLWKRCDDTVRITPISKRNGLCEYRFVFDFPLVHKARQVLLRQALMCESRTSSSQTMFRNGTKEAIRRVKQNYAEGYQHVAELDVQSCYSSFSIKGAAKILCLPESVAFNVLSIDAHNITPSNRALGGVDYHTLFDQDDPMRAFEEYFREDWAAARQGLALGSKVSPFVAEILLAPVCDKCAASAVVRVVNFADNFLLMATSPRMLSRHKAILRRSLEDHPAGPLLVGHGIKNKTPGVSFEFLGYRLEPRLGQLDAFPAPKHLTGLKEMRRKAHKKLASNMDDDRKRKVLEDTERRHRSVIDAFPHWIEGRYFHETKMEGLRSHLDGRPRRLNTGLLPSYRR